MYLTVTWAALYTKTVHVLHYYMGSAVHKDSTCTSLLHGQHCTQRQYMYFTITWAALYTKTVHVLHYYMGSAVHKNSTCTSLLHGALYTKTVHVLHYYMGSTVHKDSTCTSLLHGQCSTSLIKLPLFCNVFTGTLLDYFIFMHVGPIHKSPHEYLLPCNWSTKCLPLRST